jgi:hypothetical protein
MMPAFEFLSLVLKLLFTFLSFSFFFNIIHLFTCAYIVWVISPPCLPPLIFFYGIKHIYKIWGLSKGWEVSLCMSFLPQLFLFTRRATDRRKIKLLHQVLFSSVLRLPSSKEFIYLASLYHTSIISKLSKYHHYQLQL